MNFFTQSPQRDVGRGVHSLAVVVPDNVLIVRVRVLRQVPLDEVLGLVSGEPEQDVRLGDITDKEMLVNQREPQSMEEGKVIRKSMTGRGVALKAHLVDVPCVEADGMALLGTHVAEGEELVGHLRWPSQLAGPGETQQQQI